MRILEKVECMCIMAHLKASIKNHSRCCNHRSAIIGVTLTFFIFFNDSFLFFINFPFLGFASWGQ